MAGAAAVAVLSLVAIFANKPFSAEEALPMANLEAIARGEDGGANDDYYYNEGRYEVTRAGNGSGSLSPEEWAQFQMTSDVILVVYYNDCVWNRGRKCYSELRTPPTVIYTRQ